MELQLERLRIVAALMRLLISLDIAVDETNNAIDALYSEWVYTRSLKDSSDDV